MSDTPRTDSQLHFVPNSQGGSHIVVRADFARTLERELNAAGAAREQDRIELERLRDPHKTLARELTDMETGEKMPIALWLVETKQARVERDALKLKLEAAKSENEALRAEIQSALEGDPRNHQ